MTETEGLARELVIVSLESAVSARDAHVGVDLIGEGIAAFARACASEMATQNVHYGNVCRDEQAMTRGLLRTALRTCQ